MSAPLGLTLRWEPPPRPGRSLFVVCAYHGRDRDQGPPAPWERWETAGARGHRIVHRDHYANPRALGYLMALVEAARREIGGDQPACVVIDRAFEDAGPVNAGGDDMALADLTRAEAWSRAPLSEAPAYENVVLVYADALGLGCDRVEQWALRGRESVLVVNGRRRAFRLDRRLRRRLQVSRFLARTRLAERALALAIGSVGRVLALGDRMAGR